MPPVKEIDKFKFSNNADSSALEFKLNIHHIYVPVHVNGAGPFWFLLDSGAGMTILEKRIADSLGMEDAGNLPAVGVGGIDVGNFVKVDSLKIGNVTLYDFAAGALDFSFAEEMLVEPIQGILGYDLFSSLIVDIDYPANIITIYNPKAGIYPGRADTLQLEIESNHPVIKAVVNDSIEGRFRFDTGSQNFLDLNSPFVKKYKLLDQVEKELGTFPIMGIGGESESTLAILPSFTIGKYRLDDLITGFNLMESGILAAEHIDGNVGGGLMKWFALGFDYPDKKLYLTKVAEDDTGDGIISTGMIIKSEGDGFVVYRIIKGTPAAESGLQENDRLIAVNGTNVNGMNFDDVYDMLDGEEGDIVTIRYERDGQESQVELKLEDITEQEEN
ncbi:MAG: PDZ domain-containing protein [candidate division Zixibacteria bacterium]|nr:PDZ domain-containing protein [candidate division Zixibacteria bacterium]